MKLLLTRHRTAAAAVFFATMLVHVPCAIAHRTSYGYLKANFTEDIVTGKLELAVRDFAFAFFDFAFGPAANGDGKPNWDQLRHHEQEIDGLLLNKISLGSPGAPCSLVPGPIYLDLHGGKYFMILPFSSPCKALGELLQAGYDLMFDVDAQHRALIDVTRGNDVYSGLITPETKMLQFGAGPGNLRDTILAYVFQGAHHIWIGYDHILFLFSLLLPAVLLRMKSQWLPVNDLAGAFWRLAKPKARTTSSRCPYW